jgi:hypothetical protein
VATIERRCLTSACSRRPTHRCAGIGGQLWDLACTTLRGPAHAPLYLETLGELPCCSFYDARGGEVLTRTAGTFYGGAVTHLAYYWPAGNPRARPRRPPRDVSHLTRRATRWSTRRCGRRAYQSLRSLWRSQLNAGTLGGPRERHRGWWSSIRRCLAKPWKSSSVVKIGILRLSATAQSKKSVLDPWIPFARQRLKQLAASS